MKSTTQVFSAILVMTAVSGPLYAQAPAVPPTQQQIQTNPNGAHNAASNEKKTDMIMGAASAAAGGVIMAIYGAKMPNDCPELASECARDQMMVYGVGLGLITTGLGNMMTGAGRQSSIDPTSSGYNPGGYSAPGDGMAGTPLTPDQQAALDNAISTAKSLGVDPYNPSSVAAAKAKAGGDGMGGEDGGAAAMASLSPSEQAQLDKVKEAVASKFSISSIGTEGGGGGGGHRGHGGGDNVDLAALMGGLKGERGPASVDGLEKKVGGESIGVAEGNIFKQISKRYQAKIMVQTFRP